jgi:hypothetical protein
LGSLLTGAEAKWSGAFGSGVGVFSILPSNPGSTAKVQKKSASRRAHGAGREAL